MDREPVYGVDLVATSDASQAHTNTKDTNDAVDDTGRNCASGCAVDTTDNGLQRLVTLWPRLDDTTRQALIDRAEAEPNTIDRELQHLLDAWPTLRAGERRIVTAMLSNAERRTQRKLKT